MGAQRAARLWLLGGVLVIAVLVAATYLLAIKPVYDDKTLKEGQAGDQNLQLVQLKRTLAKLKTQADDINSYTAQLTAKKMQLPDRYDIPAFLGQLQDSDGAVRVDSNSIGVSTPVAVAGESTVVSLPITLTVAGATDELTDFINRLEAVQDRAVLLNSVILDAGNGDDEATVNLVMTAFCSKTDDDDCKVAAT